MDRDSFSLTDELAHDFDISAGSLSSELQLCIDRIDELRRREQRSVPLTAPTEDCPIEFAVAVDDTFKSELFQLRARAYTEAGWLNKGITEVVDEFDRLPTAVQVAATASGKLVGTIRVSLSAAQAARSRSAPSLPCQHEAPYEVDALMASYSRLAEFCRVAVDPDLSSRSFRTTLYGALVRTASMVAQAAHVDFALIAVHAKLSFFYQKMLGLQRLAATQAYGTIAQPTHLLGCEFAVLQRRRQSRSPFFRVSEAEVHATRAVLALTHPELARLPALDGASRRAG